jgi:hypothetical protein
MAGKTVTRADLCEAIYQKIGLSRTQSTALVELVLKEITDCLSVGKRLSCHRSACLSCAGKASVWAAIPGLVKKCR